MSLERKEGGMAEIDHRVVRVGGEAVLYLRQRFGHRPRGTLLYIHGLGESGLCFEGLLRDPRFSDWDHLVPDLPGYGKSPWSTSPLGLDEHALLLQWLLDELPLAARQGAPLPLLLIGHSMGGVIATYLAESLPVGRLQGVVNVEGNISPPDCAFSAQVAGQDLEDWPSVGYPAMLVDLYAGGETDLALRKYFVSAHLADPRALHRNSRELVAISEAKTLASRLAALDLPVTYLYGSPRGSGEQSQELLRRAGVEPIAVPEAGHWPFLDQPKIFADRLSDFLDRLP